MTLRLAEPDPLLRTSYLDALRELAEEGNGYYLEMVLPAEAGFPGVRYTRDTLGDPDTFAEFCAYTRALDGDDAPRPPSWVRGTYLWMVEDDTVLGRISLRHVLTPWLLEVGGHVGYAVRPSARRHGHATEALRQIRRVAAGHGIDPVLVTCDDDNTGSRKVIEANGGVLEDVRNRKMRFWVPTG